MVRKIKLVLASALSIALIGCGNGSGSSFASSSASGTQFTIDNTGTQDFQRVEVRNQKDNSLVYSTDFNCPAAAVDCTWNYQGPKFTEAVDLVFFDRAGRLASSFPISSDPGANYGFRTDNYLLGGYIYNRLVDSYLTSTELDHKDFNLHLSDFFVNYANRDGLYDFFDEIQSYYKIKTSASATSFDDFLKDFSARLKSGDVATISEFEGLYSYETLPSGSIFAKFQTIFIGNHETFIKSAYAQGSPSTCPAGLKAFFAGFEKAGAAASKAFPVVSGLVSGSGAVGKELCDDTANQLKSLHTQIAKLQKTVNSIEASLGKLSSFIAESEIKEYSSTIDEVFGDVYATTYAAGYVANYDNFLTLNSKADKKFTTLKDFVIVNGGLQNAFKANPVLMQLLSEDPSAYLKKISAITEPLKVKAAIDALNLKCQNPTSTVDVIKDRQNCNFFIVENINRMQLLHKRTLIMMKDVYETLALDESFSKANFVVPTNSSTSYSAAHAALKSAFDKQLLELVKYYQDGILNPDGTPVLSGSKNNDGTPQRLGLYNAFASADPTIIGSKGLYESLKKAQCWDTVNDVPRIIAMRLASDSNIAHIETACYIPNAQSSVKARYFWKVDGTDVVSISGVLVPRSSVLGNSYYKNDSSKYTYKWYMGSGWPFFASADLKSQNSYGATRCVGQIVNEARDKSVFDDAACKKNLDTSWNSNLVYAKLKDIGFTGADANNLIGQSLIMMANATINDLNWVTAMDKQNYAHAYAISGGAPNSVWLYCQTADCTVAESYKLRFRSPNADLSLKTDVDVTIYGGGWVENPRSSWGGYYNYDLYPNQWE